MIAFKNSVIQDTLKITFFILVFSYRRLLNFYNECPNGYNIFMYIQAQIGKKKCGKLCKPGPETRVHAFSSSFQLWQILRKQSPKISLLLSLKSLYWGRSTSSGTWSNMPNVTSPSPRGRDAPASVPWIGKGRRWWNRHVKESGGLEHQRDTLLCIYSFVPFLFFLFQDIRSGRRWVDGWTNLLCTTCVSQHSVLCRLPVEMVQIPVCSQHNLLGKCILAKYLYDVRDILEFGTFWINGFDYKEILF